MSRAGSDLRSYGLGNWHQLRHHRGAAEPFLMVISSLLTTPKTVHWVTTVQQSSQSVICDMKYITKGRSMKGHSVKEFCTEHQSWRIMTIVSGGPLGEFDRPVGSSIATFHVGLHITGAPIGQAKQPKGSTSFQRLLSTMMRQGRER